MSTPAQIGKAEYKAALASARDANSQLRRVLKRIMHNSQSPLTQALVGEASLQTGDIDEALNRLDDIGRQSRHFK